jgi:hypothetical protein
MRRILAGVGALIALMVWFAGQSEASWVSDHCYKDNYEDSNVRRSDAQAYAAVADNEGYEWGGGCWDNDGRDDTPGAPDSNGEGPDCSGFTFKTWELRSTYGAEGFRWWNKYQNIHGPYASDDFHDVGTSSSLPFKRLSSKSRSSTLYMDAFAKDGHIGMIYNSQTTSTGGDYIIEALGDSYGVDINDQDYRGNGAYVAVRRKSWTADCFPNCRIPPEALITVR